MRRPLARTLLLSAPGWARNELWRRARAVPSLDLRFADDKSLRDAVSGQNLITFTRASDATFVNSQGVLTTASTNVPRFDHNPTTGESLGLLPEEQRTNLLERSEEFDNAYWTKLNSSITQDAAVAPNGTTTADKLLANTTNGIHAVRRDETVLASTTYTLSFYAKAAEYTFLAINHGHTLVADYHTFFDLSNGTVGTSAVGNTASIQSVGNGWYRCSVTRTTGVSQTSLSARALACQSDNVTFFVGDTSSGIFLWGAQLEAGAFASSYIRTTGTAATRSADVADLISAAIANNIRSFYVEFSSPAVGTRGAVSLNDNTANERLAVITSGTDPRLVVHDGGVEQANIDGGTVTANDRTRVAVRIGTNDFAISVNGGAVVTDTSGTLPTVDRLMLGRTQAGEYLNGRLARFVGWSQLLPDSTLQTLGR